MAIEPIPNLPAGTIGFRAVGVVHSDDDKQVLDPAIGAEAEAIEWVAGG